MRAVACVLLAACSGSAGAPDAAPDACPKKDYGTKTVSGMSDTYLDGETWFRARLETIVAPLDQYYQLDIGLVPGRGAFRDGVQPGTYEIAGDDAAGDPTCGLCVRIGRYLVVDRYPNTIASYRAVSGTVTLTSATVPIAGTAMDVRFVSIARDENAEPTCEQSVASMTFTSTRGILP